MKTLLSHIDNLRPSATFIAIKGYKAESGEISDFNVVFNISYHNALIKSHKIVSDFVPTNEIEIQAKKELLESFEKSLSSNVEPTNDEVYRSVFNADGEKLSGVKIHRETGELHLYGLLVNKKITKSIDHKKVNSRPLTIAKNKIRNLCPVSKFRQFKLTENNFQSISIEKIEHLSSEN